MKRVSNSSIIPKIIIILGTVSVLGIILLFFRSRPSHVRLHTPRISKDKLFAQVMTVVMPQISNLWEEGPKKNDFNCPEELPSSNEIGRSFYQCQPHYWQCFWQKGSELKIDLFGQTYHVVSTASFPSIKSYSERPRYYQMQKRSSEGFDHLYGYVVEMEVKEIPGFSQTLFLADSCRDTFLPERIYGYSRAQKKTDEGFIWDNFNRNIFIDKFYVSNQQVNEWRILSGDESKLILDRNEWAKPAFLSADEQKEYCSFFGKRKLEAKLFDAGTMTPSDTKNPLPSFVTRPQTPWQRDHTKSFLGMARINSDYQLSPLDCQLAQIEGCKEKFFTTDSASWMGIHFGLGFYPEAFVNNIEPNLNLKLSSRFLPASSEWHELGRRSNWKGEQKFDGGPPVVFRCYEEVSL